MIFLNVIFSILILIICLRRYKIWSPISFFIIFNISQIISYYIMLVGDDKYYYFLKTALPIFDIGKNYLIANYLFLYFSFVISILFIFFKNKNFNINENLTNQNLKYNSININFFLNFLILIFFLFFLIFIFDVDIYKFFYYENYLDLNKPDYVSADLKISQLFLNSYYFLGVVFIGFYHFLNQSKFFKFILIILILVTFLIALAKSSRFFPLLIGFNFACIILSNSKNNKISIIAINIIFFFISYFLILYQRSLNNLGISQALINTSLMFSDYENFDLTKIFFNITNGMAVFDLTLNFNPYYSFKHKFLSSLPSISLIDNFDDTPNRITNRLSVIAPFNSFGEAYHYGIIYLSLFILIFILVLFYVSEQTKKNDFKIYTPSVLLCYFAILTTSQYNIRTNSKFIFLAFILVFLTNLFYQNKKQSLKK